jgi:hypothetical protein
VPLVRSLQTDHWSGLHPFTPGNYSSTLEHHEVEDDYLLSSSSSDRCDFFWKQNEFAVLQLGL